MAAPLVGQTLGFVEASEGAGSGARTDHISLQADLVAGRAPAAAAALVVSVFHLETGGQIVANLDETNHLVSWRAICASHIVAVL